VLVQLRVQERRKDGGGQGGARSAPGDGGCVDQPCCNVHDSVAQKRLRQRARDAAALALAAHHRGAAVAREEQRLRAALLALALARRELLQTRTQLGCDAQREQRIRDGGAREAGEGQLRDGIAVRREGVRELSGARARALPRNVATRPSTRSCDAGGSAPLPARASSCGRKASPKERTQRSLDSEGGLTAQGGSRDPARHLHHPAHQRSPSRRHSTSPS